MSSSNSSYQMFPFWPGNLEDFQLEMKKHELRLRAYQVHATFWMNIQPLISKSKWSTDDHTKLEKHLGTFSTDMKKVFNQFKDDEDYSELNPASAFMENISQWSHKSVLGASMNGDSKKYDAMVALEMFWDDFFALTTKNKDSDFAAVVATLKKNIMSAVASDKVAAK